MFRTVGFDLECTSLSGMIGRVLCCSFVEIGEDLEADRVWTIRGDDKPYRRKDLADDSRLAVAIRDTLETADIIVGHNSKLFDRKFLNARLAKAGERGLAPMWHIDTMWIVRTHMRTSSKLDNLTKFLGLPLKTDITWDDWARAVGGDRTSMDEVVTHCEADVRALAEAARKLKPFMRTMPKT